MAKNRTSRGKRQPQPDLSPTTNGIAKKWAALIIAIAVALFANYRLVAPLKQLPSPIYGGDYYFQLGQTIHVAQGGNPLDGQRFPVMLVLPRAGSGDCHHQQDGEACNR